MSYVCASPENSMALRNGIIGLKRLLGEPFIQGSSFDGRVR